MKKIHVAVIGISLGIALGVFSYLNTFIDITPGWMHPVPMYDIGEDLVVTYYNKLWIAFYDPEKKNVDYITVNGVDWSSPSTLVSLEDRFSLQSIHWLKRPDNTLWFLWTERKKDENYHRVLSYRILTNGKTWTPPKEIHYLDKSYDIKAVANAPGGGLAILGEKDSGSRDICFVQISNEQYEWSSPFPLSRTPHPNGIDIFLDNNGVLWVVYSEKGTIEVTSVQTSRDGLTWSWPEDILKESRGRGRFFQQRNSQYVFFYKSWYSITMITSPDGVVWSQPTLVATTGDCDFDVAESDDTMWIVLTGESGTSIKQYSDEKFSEDENLIRDAKIRNGIISIFAAFLCGIFLVLFVGSPLSCLISTHIQNTPRKVEKKQKRVIFGIVIAAFLVVLYYAFFFFGFCAASVTMATFTTISLVLTWFFREEESYTAFAGMLLLIVGAWIMALLQCGP